MNREQYVKSQLKQFTNEEIELMILDLLNRPTNIKPEVAEAEAKMMSLLNDEHLSRTS